MAYCFQMPAGALMNAGEPRSTILLSTLVLPLFATRRSHIGIARSFRSRERLFVCKTISIPFPDILLHETDGERGSLALAENILRRPDQ
jgi:hypothetical protein